MKINPLTRGNKSHHIGRTNNINIEYKYRYLILHVQIQIQTQIYINANNMGKTKLPMKIDPLTSHSGGIEANISVAQII